MGIFSKISKKQNLALPAKEDKVKDEKKPATPATGDKKPAAPAPRGPLARDGGGQSFRILIKPMLTEKSDRQQALGKYSFLVSPAANKVEVARAVSDLYGVKPAAVHIVNIKGKTVRFGRSSGKQKDLKKAIITLKKGDSITALEA